MKNIILLLSLIILSSCVTREEIDAAIWKNNFNFKSKDGSPTNVDELCEKYPEIKDYGFYRKLSDGTIEFISICNPLARDMLSIYNEDFKKLMDKALPKKRNPVH